GRTETRLRGYCGPLSTCPNRPDSTTVCQYVVRYGTCERFNCRNCPVRNADTPVEAERRGSGTGVTNARPATTRSEEHTSELQSRFDLVCRLLLEKKTA